MRQCHRDRYIVLLTSRPPALDARRCRQFRQVPRATRRVPERRFCGTRQSPAAGEYLSALWRRQSTQNCIRSGVPQEVPAYTVNKACASGIKSIALGFQEVAAGNLDCVLAGGTESMSRLPYYLEGARWGYRLGHQELVDGMYRDGFFCPMAEMLMGETAETLAEQYKISREEQDQFALMSQQRAQKAIGSGRFDAEIVPVTIEGKKGTTVFSRDEHLFLNAPPNAMLEKMAKLAPVFSRTGRGTITAGNSSGITDGAAAVVLASEKFVQQNDLKPLARILAATSAGVDPRVMGIGPVPAIRKMEQKHGFHLRDFELVELNDAFAAQG